MIFLRNTFLELDNLANTQVLSHNESHLKVGLYFFTKRRFSWINVFLDSSERTPGGVCPRLSFTLVESCFISIDSARDIACAGLFQNKHVNNDTSRNKNIRLAFFSSNVARLKLLKLSLEPHFSSTCSALIPRVQIAGGKNTPTAQVTIKDVCPLEKHEYLETYWYSAWRPLCSCGCDRLLLHCLLQHFSTVGPWSKELRHFLLILGHPLHWTDKYLSHTFTSQAQRFDHKPRRYPRIEYSDFVIDRTFYVEHWSAHRWARVFIMLYFVKFFRFPVHTVRTVHRLDGQCWSCSKSYWKTEITAANKKHQPKHFTCGRIISWTI